MREESKKERRKKYEREDQRYFDIHQWILFIFFEQREIRIKPYMVNAHLLDSINK